MFVPEDGTTDSWRPAPTYIIPLKRLGVGLRDAQVYCAGRLSRRVERKGFGLKRSLLVFNHTPVTPSQRSVRAWPLTRKALVVTASIQCLLKSARYGFRSVLAAPVAPDARGPCAGLQASGKDRRVDGIAIGPGGPVVAALVVRVHAYASCARRSANEGHQIVRTYANEFSTKRERN